jgi:hypothetical protein
VVNIELFDKHSVHNINTEYQDVADVASYASMLMSGDIRDYIKNVSGELYVLVVDKKWALPVFVPDKTKSQSYTSSLYSHYVSYALEEIHNLKSPIIQFIARCFFGPVGVMLRLARIDNVVFINNFLMSTNLYPDMPADKTNDISKFIAKRFPGKFIVWNSVNTKTTSELYSTAKAHGFIGLYSRSIWIQDTFTGLGSKTECILRREHKLLKSSEHKISSKFDPKRIAELYLYLYVSKYSKYNPVFTALYIEETHKRGLIEYQALTSPDSSIDGAAGFVVKGDVLTTPILGYSADLPQSSGLYRILSIHLQDTANERGKVFHCSAGVGEFKRSRGALNYREYRMIYPGNVGFWRLGTMKFFSLFVHKIAVPIMENRGL